MSSLRSRTLDERPIGPDAAAGIGASSYRLPRDPAVDLSTPADRQTVGLEGDPYQPTTLGKQTSRLTEAGQPHETEAGRPGFWRSILLGARLHLSLDVEPRGTLAPGNVRRNVAYRVNGIGAPGFFSWAANEQPAPPTSIEPARPPQDEYLVSSLHLQLPDSLSSVVSGTTKPAPGLEPFRGGATIQAQPSTGYPVLAPQIPSFGSRIPLRRPRGLVSVQEGA